MRVKVLILELHALTKTYSILHKGNFLCTKHAVINAITDLLHKERFYIREINDRKGYIFAQQGFSLFAIGRTCIVRIEESGEVVKVDIRCSNKLGIGVPGLTGSIEKKILQRLEEEL